MPAQKSYRAIADELTRAIADGTYPPGAQIPSYAQIAELYSVSESTAFRAVALLNDRGLVEGRPGRGVYVKEQT